MSEFDGRGLVAQVVTGALRSVDVDDASQWRATCAGPPCGIMHNLADTSLGHEGRPVFVVRELAEEPDNPTIGLIVYGHSEIVDTEEGSPLASRLSPPLRDMAFTAILTPDIDTTYAEVMHRVPSRTGSVMIPLSRTDEGLRADTSELSPDNVGLAILYLA